MTDNAINLKALESLLKDTIYDISVLSNFSAYVYQHLEQVNWVGFYLNKSNCLFLGPFQGKPACVEIPFSKGVCGLCATSKQTIYIPNVHDFPNHIACDTASNSELCIPLILHNQLYGILDIDSPIFNRFTPSLIHTLEQAATILIQTLEEIL